MKAILAVTSIALPLALAACDHRKTTNREMHSGAEKVADGVKEMSHAAGQKLQPVLSWTVAPGRTIQPASAR